jgi:hypothetical protein
MKSIRRLLHAKTGEQSSDPLHFQLARFGKQSFPQQYQHLSIIPPFWGKFPLRISSASQFPLPRFGEWDFLTQNHAPLILSSTPDQSHDSAQ